MTFCRRCIAVVFCACLLPCALLSGEVQAAFLSTTTTNAQIKSGKLKAIA